MGIVSPRVVNSLWQVSSYRAWWHFKRAARQVERTQSNLLKNYLNRNKDTKYGRRYGFEKIKSISAFQETVPITTYDDYVEEIEEIGKGRANVLTSSPVRMFEPSSGSTAPSKLIPYTDQLQREFQRAISAWIFNLFLRYPDLKDGPAYWSISPLTEGRKHSSGGIAIGFEEDSAYLGGLGKVLVDRQMAVPGSVKNVEDIENFRYVTLLHLIAASELRIISVWNPTFLKLLLEPMEGWWPRLVEDLRTGQINLPNPSGVGGVSEIKPNPRRTDGLTGIEPTDYLAIWPNLKLISCWMDGPAAPHAENLKTLFPGVIFQGKGLIATEAFVSFPIVGLSGAALATNSHFFEFLPIDRDGQSVDAKDPHLAHQLEKGKHYSVLVTTGGGLYRYHLQDIVEVVGHCQHIPLLRFIGKTDQVSDWFGEKLSERFVANCLNEVFSSFNLEPLFVLVAPSEEGGGFRYRLFLELPEEQRIGFGQRELIAAFEETLCSNFHYAYCRKLGQITHADLYLIEHGGREAYLSACNQRGQRMGDIKPRVLETTTGWENYFEGILDNVPVNSWK
jgi:hypothetical protein